MKNLAKDVVNKGEVFEPPLVFPMGDKFIVADGNRRTTCLKLLANSRRAPTVELQQFFLELRAKWPGDFPDKVECRVEMDRDRVDEILFRRHTGVQGGIGQSTWTDRMKSNFVVRTGKSDSLHIADEVEKILKSAKLLPTRKIPRSNLNRLLSSEAIRQRVGLSVQKGKLAFVKDRERSIVALARIASDLASRSVTLDEIWDSEAKRSYLDKLDREGVLPPVKVDDLTPLDDETHSIDPIDAPPEKPKITPIIPPKAVPLLRLIPADEREVIWTAKLQRHREIWEELQFKLSLADHLNAISVLLRFLIELSIENYVKQAQLSTVHENDKLALKARKVAEDLKQLGLIDDKYLGVIKKLERSEEILSMDTLNRYVHSPNFRVSPEHLKMIWGSLNEFVVLCLNR